MNINVLLFLLALVIDMFAVRLLIKGIRLGNDSITAVTEGRIFRVVRVKYLFITYWIAYHFEFVADGRTYKAASGVSPFKPLSDEELNSAQKIRYSVSHPKDAELVCLKRRHRFAVGVIFCVIAVALTLVTGIYAFEGYLH